MQIKLLLTALSAAALLAGCAHPDLIEPGQSSASVEQELGAPDSRIDHPDGTFILVYSGQPFGRENYWMHFDKDGHFVGKETLMNEEHFKLVIPGKHTKKDVYQMFGHCAQEYTFALQDQTAFMYRFRETSGMAMAFWVQFDLDGVVTETAVTQDPWDHDRDPLFLH
ncbi:MAG TPA: hypothetical protein IAC66_02035 [Candidatus Aphodousia gallistercoris]|nr:hypothetical protein [Candidatus Aphodousia gallistercoris]